MEEKQKKSYENLGNRNPNLQRGAKKEVNKPFSTFRKKIVPKSEEEPTEKKEKIIMRLNKYLAHAGIADRRKCDELIKRGFVKVNGNVVKEAGVKVNLFDEVMYKDKIVRPEKKVYVLLNKPKDFVLMTKTDRRKKSVMNLVRTVGDELGLEYRLKLLPVGQMQRETTGLLLLTNDDELQAKMEDDKVSMLKMFKVMLNKDLADADFEKIEAQVEDISFLEKGNLKEVGIKITQGNLRDILKQVGYKIELMDRVILAGLTKKDLPRGNWRMLTQKEVTRLKYSKKL